MTQGNDQQTYPTMTDLGPPSLLEGEYVEVKDLVDQRILVTAIGDYHAKTAGKYEQKPTLAISALTEDKTEIFFFCNHAILYRKFDWARGKTPFVATIFQPEGKDYYDVK